MSKKELVFSVNVGRDDFVDWLAEKFYYAQNEKHRKLIDLAAEHLGTERRFSKEFYAVQPVQPRAPLYVAINPAVRQKSGEIFCSQEDFHEKTRVVKDTESYIGEMPFFKILPMGENRAEIEAGYLGDTQVVFCQLLLIIADTYQEAGTKIADYLKRVLPPQTNLATNGTQADELPEPQADKRKEKYDDVCIAWVNRPEIPFQSVGRFLQEHAPDLTERTFYRVALPGAYNRGWIDCEIYPSGRKRYKAIG